VNIDEDVDAEDLVLQMNRRPQKSSHDQGRRPLFACSPFDLYQLPGIEYSLNK
jgi:hypothetical protein